jgi:uncharacterized protein YkwD
MHHPRPRLLKLLVAALVCVPAAVTATPASAAKGAQMAKTCANASLVPNAGNLKKVNKAALCLVNRERSKRHLPPLKQQAALNRTATRYAKRLVAERFFDHTAPDGTTLVKRIRTAGYLKGNPRRWWVSENIAYGPGNVGTPTLIVKAWMKSDDHRANILQRRFRDIGLGVTLGSPDGSRGATYVHDFGRRQG